MSSLTPDALLQTSDVGNNLDQLKDFCSVKANISSQLERNRVEQANSIRLTPQQLSSTTTNDISLDLNNIRDDFKSFKDEIKTKKREVYRFQTEWLVSSLAWSNEPGESLNLALGSFIEDYKNQIQLVTLAKDSHDEEIESITSFDHPYPATKVLWIPRPSGSFVPLPKLLATTSDYLRLWRIVGGKDPSSSFECDSTCLPETEVKLESLLNTNSGSKHCAPLTSFDWNEIDPSIIVTSSVDTTCAIWDIDVGKIIADQIAVGERVGGQLISTTSSSPSLTRSPTTTTNIGQEPNSSIHSNLRSQIVAHDHEVYDVSFSRSGSGRDVFVSAGGDGSVRLFDLRMLSTSKILYEQTDEDIFTNSSDSKALVRVSCNKQNPNYVSAFATNSKDIILLDIRNTGMPIAVLKSHTAQLNCMSWAPHSAHHICTASDDHQALIWELSKLPNPIDEPLLAYRANGKINCISWSTLQSDWIAIGFDDYLELLRV